MNEMNEQIAIERLTWQVKDYAKARAHDVARGAETPRLAALLVQKYGCGMVDAITEIFGRSCVAKTIHDLVDEEVAKIDPLWREHARERWAARPADVVESLEKNPKSRKETWDLESKILPR